MSRNNERKALREAGEQGAGGRFESELPVRKRKAPRVKRETGMSALGGAVTIARVSEQRMADVVGVDAELVAAARERFAACERFEVEKDGVVGLAMS